MRCVFAQREVVSVCGDCRKHIRKGRAFRCSIADGRDYGNPDRLGLPVPTVLERAVLQDVRAFGSILKLTIDGASRLAGHFISFFAEGTERIVNYMTADAVKTHLRVQLVGPAGNGIDKLKQLCRQHADMQVGARVLYNYLAVRRALHPDDPEGALRSALPSALDLEARLEALARALPEALIADATVATDELVRDVEQAAAAAADDVAQVRAPEEGVAAGGGGGGEPLEVRSAGSAATCSREGGELPAF